MLYPVHIAPNRHDPLPPVAELSSIEADSPQEALELLKREPLAMIGARFKPFGCALSSANGRTETPATFSQRKCRYNGSTR